MAPRKSKLNAASIGVAFSAVTRAKLNLIAAGLDRPVGWVIRDAVGLYLGGYAELNEYRKRFPNLATALDAAIKEAGGDMDEIYGRIDDGAPSIDHGSIATKVAKPSNEHGE
jgi:hypothetical protein